MLWRRWDQSLPVVNFVGLNPSTADEHRDDPTMRRCRQFAVSWGYGGFLMTNIFAFRATRPRDLKAAREPVGLQNDQWILRAADDAKLIVFVWGTHGSFRGRDGDVISLLGPRGQCIALTKGGKPAHPLYLKKGLTPVPFAP
ncbi:MAG: DUF1643 domain-containing protein [Bryobacteraceae bacterium]|nr:DUF1643 domain-containing protein [Bryobacteraceae bacterium]